MLQPPRKNISHSELDHAYLKNEIINLIITNGDPKKDSISLLKYSISLLNPSISLLKDSISLLNPSIMDTFWDLFLNYVKQGKLFAVVKDKTLFVTNIKSENSIIYFQDGRFVIETGYENVVTSDCKIILQFAKHIFSQYKVVFQYNDSIYD